MSFTTEKVRDEPGIVTQEKALNSIEVIHQLESSDPEKPYESVSEKDELELLEDEDPCDILNPRNWSTTRKSLLFIALMSSSILTDGGMVWGATVVAQQAVEWNISVAHSATSLNYGILLQGFGGIFAVPLIIAYGRLPIWIWPQLITMCMLIGCCYSQSWGVFTTFRSLQGLFGTVPQVIGLPIIYDMYHPRDWSRMINIWGTTFLIGPHIGPAIAGYISVGTGWRNVFKVLTGLYGLSSILVILFGRETYYVKGRNTQTSSRVKALFGIGNTNLLKGATISASSTDLINFTFKTILLLTGFATMINFTWPIGEVTTIDSVVRAPPYLLNTVQASSIRFAPVFGSLVGFTIGDLFNSLIFRTRHSVWRPEYRLHGIWWSIATLTIGLLIYGLTLNYHKSIVGIIFGWGILVAGNIGQIVAITSFVLEKYPSHSVEVSAIINMWRTCGGFAVGYFQPQWIARSGAAAVFGIQALIVVAVMVLTIVPVMILGIRGQKTVKL